MPNNRDHDDDVRDRVEEDDLIGAGDEDEEDDDVDEDGDILDEEDEDELDEDDEDDEDEEMEEGDDEISAGARSDVTAEVGSEGGSPGEAVDRLHGRAGLGQGSEATTTWSGGDDRTRERRDEDGILIKRAPRG